MRSRRLRAHSQCTISRCCADPEHFECALNKNSSVAEKGRWYAECRPKLNMTATSSAIWVSAEKWTTWRDALWRGANDYATDRLGIDQLQPAEVASIVIASCVAVLITVACAMGWRHRHVQRVRLLETELCGATARPSIPWGICEHWPCCPPCQPLTQRSHDRATTAQGGYEEQDGTNPKRDTAARREGGHWCLI